MKIETYRLNSPEMVDEVLAEIEARMALVGFKINNPKTFAKEYKTFLNRYLKLRANLAGTNVFEYREDIKNISLHFWIQFCASSMKVEKSFSTFQRHLNLAEISGEVYIDDQDVWDSISSSYKDMKKLFPDYAGEFSISFHGEDNSYIYGLNIKEAKIK